MTGDGRQSRKGETHRLWSRRAAYWDRHADKLAEMADRLNEPMLSAAGIAPGQRVLDLASGAGEPCLSIARRVGPGGTVFATDLVDEMLSGARRRAREAALANVRFEVADMEALPFADASFDRVTCRFGLMFCPEPLRALAEARRVLVPQGRAAFMVWGPRADTSLFDALAAAAAEVFGADEEIDYDTPFRFAEAGTLAAAMAAAGLVDVSEDALRFRPRIPVGETFWLPQQEMGMGHRLARAGKAERAAFDAAVRRNLARYLKGRAYELSLHARLGVGRAPGG